MDYNNDDDCPCTLNEVELFDPIDKQVILESSSETKYSPVSAITTEDGSFEFNVLGTTNEFIDLNDTELMIEAKVVNSNGGGNLTDIDDVAAVNNWAHSMFSDIKLQIGDKIVEGGEHMYPYKAYLVNLFTHSKESKSTQLQNCGWYKDTTGSMNLSTAANKGYTKRKALIAKSETKQFSFPLLLDMMLQNKYLLPNTPMKLTLTRNKPEFQLLIHTAATETNRAKGLKVILQSATLFVRRVKAIASFLETMENRLMLQNAQYPIQRTELKTFTIAKGLRSYTIQSLFSSTIPKMVWIGFVRNDAYNGTYTQNPFNFKHFNVDSVMLSASSKTAHFEQYTPDFTKKMYAREYNALFKALGLYNKSESMDITMEEFGDGYTFFAFNLTPDQHTSGHAQISRNGTIRLDLSFSTDTPVPINVIAMGIFDGRIQITKNRAVHCDWK